jgi:hypothetical protein
MMSTHNDVWSDEAAGPLVRPYALVRGRTRPMRPELHLVTQVLASPFPADNDTLSVEHLEIMSLCQRALSVAEVAAYLKVPLIVVKVLLSDLIQRGDVVIRDPSRVQHVPDRNLLQAVLDGVRAI